jgi:hypothetical protein
MNLCGRVGRRCPRGFGLKNTKRAAQDSLLAEIKAFNKLYDENMTANTITVRMHRLFSHVEPVLRKYGTIGFFDEDGLTSVHCVTNKYGGTFQTAKSDKQMECIINSKQVCSVRHLNQKAEREKVGKPPKKKARCEQGENKQGIAFTDPSDAISKQVEADAAPL